MSEVGNVFFQGSHAPQGPRYHSDAKANIEDAQAFGWHPIQEGTSSFFDWGARCIKHHRSPEKTNDALIGRSHSIMTPHPSGIVTIATSSSGAPSGIVNRMRDLR